jgi:hypothetical protein
MAQFTTALANDYNVVRNTVANVLGTGSGTKGYGSPIGSYTVSVGNFIGAAEFAALTLDINACYRHITNSNATLAPVVTNGLVTWANFVTYQSAVDFINNNSDVNGGATSVATNSTTLPAGWGNASGNRIATMTGTVTFADAEAMRFFFNQGNSVQMSGSGSGGEGDPKADSFRSLAGSVNISHTQATYRAGSSPTATYFGSTNPYGYAPPGIRNNFIQVTLGSPAGNTISFTIVCNDKGNDLLVPSNVGANLTFNINRTISNTAGISTYGPSVSFGSWSYTA